MGKLRIIESRTTHEKPPVARDVEQRRALAVSAFTCVSRFHSHPTFTQQIILCEVHRLPQLLRLAWKLFKDAFSVLGDEDMILREAEVIFI